MNPQADVRIKKLRYENGQAHFNVSYKEGKIKGLVLPMPGDHNVLNATAAIATALHMGISPDEIKDALKDFGGVNRRFTRVAEIEGVTIIDDYAHHPVEIAAVLKAARQSTEGRVIAIHQPHRYSRLEDLFEGFCGCFNDADIAAIAPVFAAGEAPIEGVDHVTLAAGLVTHGHKNATVIDSEEGLAALVKAEAQPGDMVVCLGAGTISAWANRLPEALK